MARRNKQQHREETHKQVDSLVNEGAIGPHEGRYLKAVYDQKAGHRKAKQKK